MMTYSLILYVIFILLKVLCHVVTLISYSRPVHSPSFPPALPVSLYLGGMCVYASPSSSHWSETDMIAFMILT